MEQQTNCVHNLILTTNTDMSVLIQNRFDIFFKKIHNKYHDVHIPVISLKPIYDIYAITWNIGQYTKSDHKSEMLDELTKILNDELPFQEYLIALQEVNSKTDINMLIDKYGKHRVISDLGLCVIMPNNISNATKIYSVANRVLGVSIKYNGQKLIIWCIHANAKKYSYRTCISDIFTYVRNYNMTCRHLICGDFNSRQFHPNNMKAVAFSANYDILIDKILLCSYDDLLNLYNYYTHEYIQYMKKKQAKLKHEKLAKLKQNDMLNYIMPKYLHHVNLQNDVLKTHNKKNKKYCTLVCRDHHHTYKSRHIHFDVVGQDDNNFYDGYDGNHHNKNNKNNENENNNVNENEDNNYNSSHGNY